MGPLDATNDHTRAVVEMHSYRWVGGGVPGGWVDSTSRSMTVRVALMANDRNLQYTWGAIGSEACRVNGPGGPVACSVPNTSRVAFYSPNETPSGTTWYAGIYEVSFRDAAGVAHYYNRSDRLQMITETWYA